MSPYAWPGLLLLPALYPHLMYNSWFDVCISDWPTKKSEKRNKLQKNDGNGPWHPNDNKLQKNDGDGPWHLNDNSGALFCMPNNDEFKSSYLSVVTKPYMFMQPPIDTPEGHRIIGPFLSIGLQSSRAKYMLLSCQSKNSKTCRCTVLAGCGQGRRILATSLYHLR